MGSLELAGASQGVPPLPQVAEIHRASKEGQLYCVGGSTSSCSAQAEPPEPTKHDILPASQVYSVSLPRHQRPGPSPFILAPSLLLLASQP